MSAAPPKRGKRSARAADLEEKARRWLVPAAAAFVVLLCIIVGMIFGPGFGVLVLAAGTMVGAIASLWSSLRALFGETPLSREDAYAIGAPSNEEEQKRAVLRAIKDLEFERGVGKISEADYRELVGRYRAEAKRLLRQIDSDAQPERERVERMVASHLRAQGIEPGWLTATAGDEPAGGWRIEPDDARDSDAPDEPVESDEDATEARP